MKITTLEIAGFAPALKGMRNPMNSWDKSDSGICKYVDDCTDICMTHCDVPTGDCFKIGEADMGLAKRLIKGGGEHRKFLRQIQVWADFDMPRYWWSEFDTYHFNTKNSCSTMHKLLQTDLTLDSFVTCIEDTDLIEMIIERVKNIQYLYKLSIEKKDTDTVNRCLLRAKRLLCEGFLQLRTVNTNYEELMNIYHQRKNHRLKEEWIDTFCKWCESLPYFKELCLDK